MCPYLGSNGASSRHSLQQRDRERERGGERARMGQFEYIEEGTHQVAVVVCADHV